MGLQHFDTTGDIVISQQEAYEILFWFFRGYALSPEQLTDNDLSFAQSLMIEAIMRSKDVGYIARLWRGTASPSKNIVKTLRNVATYVMSARLWYRVKPADLQNPEIYQMVKDDLITEWKSAWVIRVTTGDPVY